MRVPAIISVVRQGDQRGVGLDQWIGREACEVLVERGRPPLEGIEEQTVPSAVVDREVVPDEQVLGVIRLHRLGHGLLGDRRGEDADRKSPRLNSRHVAIAYGVLCVKKQKNKDMSSYVMKRLEVCRIRIV